MASKLCKIVRPSYIFRAINNINNTNGMRRATWLTPIAALHSSSECTLSMFQGSRGKLCRQTTHLYGNLTVLQNTRGLSSYAGGQKEQFNEEGHKKDIIGSEDTFNPLTDKIPEKPVTFVEGASYSVVILAALGIAGAVAYAVITELLIEPIEYKVFGKALARVQQDNQIKARIGSPITGYGQESRNRAARQRFPYRKWTDEEGIERVEVQFHIRGPSGSGVTTSEMFKDKKDKTWKYTYLIVDITSPTKTRMILESYIPS